ncbi:hypothetical protein BDV12DRAFT_195379 [Aspergillus spectabilis]
MLPCSEDKDKVFKYLKYQSVWRFVPPRKQFTTEAANSLLKRLEGGSVQLNPDDAGFKTCYRNGWVQRVTVKDDEGDIAILPSRFHEKYIEYRFKEGVRYYPWIKEGIIEDWIIIDRASSPPTGRYSDPRLWHAVFTNIYNNLKIYDHQNQLLSVRLKN